MEALTQSVIAWLQTSAHDPFMLALALALATFVTEDGALLTGGVLASTGAANPLLVIAALSAGITIGDIGLYALGWSARSQSFLRKRLPVHKARPLRKWLQGREVIVLFVSRFAPGTRLVTYITFGFLKLSLLRFATVMGLAGLIWVSGMVLFMREIQKTLANYGSWPSLAAALVFGIIVLLLVPRLVKRFGPPKDLTNNKNDMDGATNHAR